ncbi:hypothetical protein PI125_g5408 [Phytophthora idaei]|nr:hypothetical protein PI125_g5408 [Phytophthora idaei]
MESTIDIGYQRAVPITFAITSIKLPRRQSTRCVLRLFNEVYTYLGGTIGIAGSDFETPQVDPTMMSNTGVAVHVASTTEYGVQKTIIKYAKHNSSPAIRIRFEEKMVPFPHTKTSLTPTDDSACLNTSSEDWLTTLIVRPDICSGLGLCGSRQRSLNETGQRYHLLPQTLPYSTGGHHNRQPQENDDEHNVKRTVLSSVQVKSLKEYAGATMVFRRRMELMP